MMFFAKIDGAPTWKQEPKTLARFIPLFQTSQAAMSYAETVAQKHEAITTHAVDMSQHGG